MKLNGAIFETLEYDGTEVLSMREMIKCLFNAKDIVAEVYINGKLAFTSTAILSDDSGYMLAYVNGIFSLSEDVIVENIQINVKQAGSDCNLFKSYTVVNDLIQAGDYQAKLCFKVVNTVPYCTNKVHLHDSEFVPLNTNKITPIVLEYQPSANEDVSTDTCTIIVPYLLNMDGSYIGLAGLINDKASAMSPENIEPDVDTDHDGENDYVLDVAIPFSSINPDITEQLSNESFNLLYNTQVEFDKITLTYNDGIYDHCNIISVEDNDTTKESTLVVSMPHEKGILLVQLNILGTPSETINETVPWEDIVSALDYKTTLPDKYSDNETYTATDNNGETVTFTKIVDLAFTSAKQKYTYKDGSTYIIDENADLPSNMTLLRGDNQNILYGALMVGGSILSNYDITYTDNSLTILINYSALQSDGSNVYTLEESSNDSEETMDTSEP